MISLDLQDWMRYGTWIASNLKQHQHREWLATTGQAATRYMPSTGRIEWFRYSTPEAGCRLAGRLAPWFLALAAGLFLLGVLTGLLMAPLSGNQNDVSRIVVLHVPAAWVSLVIYLSIAFWTVVGLVLHTKLAFMMGHALGPTGALITLLALVTGALWGKPVSGSWWNWDARLMAELFLLLFYIGYIVLHYVIEDTQRADRVCALVILAGVICLPLVYFSMLWWSVARHGMPFALPDIAGMTPSMIAATLLVTAGLWIYGAAAALQRLCCIVLERERDADWAFEYATGQ